MAYEWQLTSGVASWQHPTELRFRQVNNSEYSLSLVVDPAFLNTNDHDDASYRTIMETVIAAVEPLGFEFIYGGKIEPNTYELTEIEPEPEV